MMDRQETDGLEEQLAAFLEGQLDDAATASFAHRLAEDGALRSELKAEARLRRLTADLPREIEPASDLFPGIAARLEPRKAEVRSGPWAQRSRSRQSHSRPARSWVTALAALLGVALGVALTFAALTGSKVDPGSLDSEASATAGTLAGVEADLGTIRPAGFEQGSVTAQIEADFFRARESLWIELLASREHLPPESWQAVVENLGLLDQVIRELRQALDADPGNRRLERLLLSNHQRQLDVLNKVTREV